MKKGFIALPLIILISGIVLEVALSLALISYYLVQISFGGKSSNEALSAAQTGIDDAVIRIVRNNGFSSSYTLSIDNIKKTDVVVCKESKTTVANCDTQNLGKDEVTSTGKFFNRNRRLRAFVNVDNEKGEISVESVTEIPI